MKILLIHGPNLNNLGRRDPNHYGFIALEQIEEITKKEAKRYDCQVDCFQSNHEGGLIDYLQERSEEACGIIINPGALSHYSYALRDALVDTGLPCVEVHLSDIYQREEWRRVSVISPVCIGQISGKKESGYIEAVNLLIQRVKNNT